jgi:arsenate reductase
MDKRPLDILRRKEAEEEGIDLRSDDAQLIEAIAAHPRTLERPIVVNCDKAAIGRPPEAVLSIL